MARPASTTRGGAGDKPGRRRNADRLSLEDWTSKALDLLMTEGVHAVKITRLCEELGVTKGSFYWHFADLDALMEAIANRWSELTREILGQLAKLDHQPPVERLRAMAHRLIDDRSWTVERALREWARSDTQVAATVTESDRFVFELVQQALRDLGFDARQARLRSGLLVYAGIGFAHGMAALPKPTVTDIEDLLDLITTGAPPAP
ncbi:TetR/AcrR family transcriptional regulator [Amycolatopsis acidicola]|uniref:TetR/AcrR family transcriptional regulator n=1 Tax=Amycolatopsis acidicola TaxID=2596893 RepID=A0A5N0UT34_9PSEU|nr:TetR/AcrR family transcriptional regulator [Amycolatopsis acidicola]KAA9152323.1 TetR/AcrR family transcriptional regulator [Amycolatopsis acidicola]